MADISLVVVCKRTFLNQTTTGAIKYYAAGEYVKELFSIKPQPKSDSEISYIQYVKELFSIKPQQMMMNACPLA